MITIGILTALGLAVGAPLGEVLRRSHRLLLGSLFNHGSTAQMLKHYVMPIHTKNGATVCTPNGFAMKQRIERLKRELRINRKINKIGASYDRTH